MLQDVALHLVQRGVNRDRCFFAPADYADYLRLLAVFSDEYGCSIHAYCLMTNHVHLLLTPHRHEACARLMKGRFHSSLVASDEYALACYRYIELNPVRAGLVSDPRDYAWSSYRSNAEGEPDPLLRPHAAYLALEGSYRRLFAVDLPESQVDDIRKATRGGYRVGEKRRPRGRPRRPENFPSARPD